MSVFKKQQQMVCISRQCWLFIFNPFLADLLVLQFTSICASVLTWLTLETTAQRGQHVFTCAWTAKKSRMSGAGPAVSQVHVLWQFGSMAGYRCCALEPKANFGVSFSSCFPPLFHLPRPLMHLYLLSGSWSTKTDGGIGLPFSLRLDSCDPIFTFAKYPWLLLRSPDKNPNWSNIKRYLEEFSGSQEPIFSGDLQGCERSSPQAPLRVPVDPHRQSVSPTPSSNNQSR